MPVRGKFKHTVRAGQVFGRLRVIRSLRRYKKGDGDLRYRVLCRCACGAETRVSKFELIRGDTTSCGCAARELLVKRNRETSPMRTHGATSKDASPALKRTFSSWKAAKARTTNPKGKDHHLYYDRGIRMCRRWFNSFAAFLEDVGLRPEGKTLDRIDPDGPYALRHRGKLQCRWADYSTQTRNQRRVRKLGEAQA